MSNRSRRLRSAVPLLTTLLVVAPAAAAQDEAPDLFREGVERYSDGDYTGAQRVLREYVEAYGDRQGTNAEHLGEAYHYLGLMTPDASLAEGYFLAVAQRYPSAPVADESVARLAQLYTVRGDHEEARKQWQSLARSYPLSRYVPEVDLRVGEILFQEGELEGAYDAFERGFSRMKDYQRSGASGANLRDLEGEYVYWIGRTLLARGAEGDARKYLNLVLLDYPGHPLEPLALYYLSETYRAEGKDVEADDAWRRFGETVRNTSLESVSENPNLVAVARARESGDLNRRIDPDEGAGEDAEGAADAEALARGDVEAGLEPDGEPQSLRAPEPGRAGGEVPQERLGMPVETQSDTATADVGAAAGEPTDAEAQAEAAGDEAATNEVLRPPDELVQDDEAALERAEDAEEQVAEAEEDARRAAEDAGREAAEAEEDARDEAEDVAEEVAEAEENARDEGAEVAEEVAEAEAARREADEAAERAMARERAVADAGDGRGSEVAEAAPAPDVAETLPEEPAREAPVLEQGRAAVAGQVPSEGGEVSAAELEPIPPGKVFLQVGAFTSAQSASALSAQLRKKGFEPALHSGLVNGQGYYRVRFGPYEVPPERAILESMRNALARQGFEAVVMRDERQE